MILTKTDFGFKVSDFFSDYLINRWTQYICDLSTSSFLRVDIGIEQESVLLLILSAFYIVSIFHILKKRSKNLFIFILISILLFVDDGFFIS